ncbi:uncharacterized protein MYCGRDRAFT_93617 [Zymoseptoria tritici IPO323]|uniref:Uncharacterized protein n=1 Tax=Zymoseptoria tritici (strain CBS 115943 / IPO323) TaxID=336722 RepID=F9XE38_ZYMTI|nr:uncharacterized protein MYCGRDRAFT_93617 [Zymoseptoria tritici IPO323]EGP86976.1 hypothetical protein MYCGRDRAFT_93617 [Zymoseptoria tritici IPO323]
MAEAKFRLTQEARREVARRCGAEDMTFETPLYLGEYSADPITAMTQMIDLGSFAQSTKEALLKLGHTDLAELIHDLLTPAYDESMRRADLRLCAKAFKLGVSLAINGDISEFFPSAYPQQLKTDCNNFKVDLFRLLLDLSTDKDVPGPQGKGKQRAISLSVDEQIDEATPEHSSEDEEDAPLPTSKRSKSSLSTASKGKAAKKSTKDWTATHPKLDAVGFDTAVKEVLRIGRQFKSKGITEVAYSRHKAAPDWFDKNSKIYARRADDLLSAIDKNGLYLLPKSEVKNFGDPEKLNRDRLDKSNNAKGVPRKR